MSKLVVRNNGQNTRIWFGQAPEGTKGATTLTDEQSEALARGIMALDPAKFAKHQAMLQAGKTIKANHTGQIARLVKHVRTDAYLPKQAEQPKADVPANGKKQLSEKQLAALAKGRAKRDRNRQAKKAQEPVLELSLDQQIVAARNAGDMQLLTKLVDKKFGL